jgi:hypothetical protein
LWLSSLGAHKQNKRRRQQAIGCYINKTKEDNKRWLIVVALTMMAKRKRALQKKKSVTWVEEQGRWEFFF